MKACFDGKTSLIKRLRSMVDGYDNLISDFLDKKKPQDPNLGQREVEGTKKSEDSNLERQGQVNGQGEAQGKKKKSEGMGKKAEFRKNYLEMRGKSINFTKLTQNQ